MKKTITILSAFPAYRCRLFFTVQLLCIAQFRVRSLWSPCIRPVALARTPVDRGGHAGGAGQYGDDE